MAVIQKLRASGIVVGAVVVALIAFIATDAIKSNGNSQNTDQNIISEVGGDKVEISEFNEIANKYFQADMAQYQTQEEQAKNFEDARSRAFERAWSDLLNNRTFNKAVENSGVSVTDIDIQEMFLGKNPDQVAMSVPNFMDNGQYSRSKVKELFRNAKRDKQLKGQLLEFIDGVKKSTEAQRYSKLIANTLHTTTLEKEYQYIAANQGISGSIVALNYSSIPDGEVKPTDKDYQSYYKGHKYLFKQEVDERDIEFVSWDVIPSGSDTILALEEANDKISAYALEGPNDTLGAGVSNYISLDLLPKKDSVETAFYKSVFNSTIGGVVGPKYHNGKFFVGRKIKEKSSENPIVEASHILISTNPQVQNKVPVADSIAAQELANDLLKKIKSGANFEELAKQYSADPGSGANGGKLEATPVKNYATEFGDFCKSHLKGEIGVVKTQFGYHIIRMDESPADKLVKLRVELVEILPGSDITKIADAASTKFINSLNYKDDKTFGVTQKKSNLTPRIVKDINTTTSEIAGLTDKSDSKQIINWLFNETRKTGDISGVFQFRDKYIVVHVTSSRNRGYADWTDVKDKMDAEVRKEMKANMLLTKFNKSYNSKISAKDLAQKTGATFIPIENFKASQNFLPTLMKDDKILGALIGTTSGKSTKPVVGSQAVAVVFVSKVDKIEIPKSGLGDNNPFDAMNSSDFVMRRINQALYNKAQIQDYRFRQDLGN
jgi:peptidyl-prolyl cis-trans isomerase D